MTAMQAIERADALMPNQFSEAEKLMWLETLDTVMANELDGMAFPEEHYDAETVLAASGAYEEMYIHWLHAKQLYFLGEFTRYQNASAQFADVYRSFEAARIRAEKPRAKAALHY